MTIAEIAASRPARTYRIASLARTLRAQARLISALVLLAFVLCHLVSHMALIVSLPVADAALGFLMAFWWTHLGGVVLATALAVHLLNALWSIYIRRYLRMPRWEMAQLALGLTIPPLLMAHVIGTRVSDQYLGTSNSYDTVLLKQWVLSSTSAYLQMAAVVVLWLHACIGLHFWLRTKRFYPAWRPLLSALALLIPALSIAGFIAGGAQVMREAAQPGFADTVLKNSRVTPEASVQSASIGSIAFAAYAVLVALPFTGRGIRALVYRARRPPRLSHSGGRIMSIRPGATVLETLRAHGIPHASVCGGRGRCSTCRIRVVSGLDTLHAPDTIEAAALARIAAPDGMRLACQIRPTADLAIMPALAADARASDGLVRGGMEGSEHRVTVVFVDLRGSTTLGEAKMPYDVLFILNQFFNEMNRALTASGGHYSNFTGDGLMALYGLDTEPKLGAIQALRGARDMLVRLAQLNAQLGAELPSPLRIGIGIHHGDAIVGAMGPPGSQIVTAIGDTVNTTARLEGLTKDHNCSLVLSRQAAEAAGINPGAAPLYQAAVKGRAETVEFYALDDVPDTAS
jgi:adenylate cyclase